jgi:hypothetical protein
MRPISSSGLGGTARLDAMSDMRTPKPSGRAGAMRLVPPSFPVARVMLLLQAALCLLGAAYVPGISHSVAAAVVAASIFAVFGLAHVAALVALRPARRAVCKAAGGLEIFWIPIWLLFLLWPSGSQGYLDFFFLLLILGSVASAAELLSQPSRGAPVD